MFVRTVSLENWLLFPKASTTPYMKMELVVVNLMGSMFVVDWNVICTGCSQVELLIGGGRVP
jgi:hypothetical protein